MAASRLIPVLALALLLLAAGSAVSESYEQNGQEFEETEVFNPSPGALISFNGSNSDHIIYDEYVVVETNVSDNNAPNKIAADGKDYTWNTNNGTLTVNDTGVLADADSAEITYSVFAPLEEQRHLAQLSAGLLDIAQYAILVGVLGAVVFAIMRLGSI